MSATSRRSIRNIIQFVVLADAGINTIEDLKGKSITTQQRGNTGELITRQLLEVHGLTYNDVKVSFVGYTDSVKQMKDGHARRLRARHQIPAGAIMDLAAARDIKLLDLSRQPRRHAQAQSRATSWSPSRRAPIRSRTRT